MTNSQIGSIDNLGNFRALKEGITKILVQDSIGNEAETFDIIVRQEQNQSLCPDGTTQLPISMPGLPVICIPINGDKCPEGTTEIPIQIEGLPPMCIPNRNN